MDKLISLQAAIDAWKEDFKGFVNSLHMPRDDYKGIMEYIDEVPSAQPEIIRCKDCKKREHCRTTNTWAVAPDDDWYCGDAERRSDGV